VSAACLATCASAVALDGSGLPDIETVLTKAKGKAQSFAEQARAMQQRVEEEQNRSRVALRLAKEDYERRLRTQADEITSITMQNLDMRRQCRELNTKNNATLKEAKTFASANEAMRSVLESVQQKVKAAHLFLQDSMDKTDDSSAKELIVLEPTTPKPTLDHFLHVAEEQSGTADVALLQIETRPTHNTHKPEDLVKILSSSLADITTAEKEGAVELEASFMRNFEVGEKRKQELLEIQGQGIAERAELNTTRYQLLEARHHLRDTFFQLEKRLHGMRIFARKVDSMAADALKGSSNETLVLPSPSQVKSLVRSNGQSQENGFPWPSWMHPASTSTTRAARTRTTTTTTNAKETTSTTTVTTTAASVTTTTVRTPRKGRKNEAKAEMKKPATSAAPEHKSSARKKPDASQPVAPVVKAHNHSAKTDIADVTDAASEREKRRTLRKQIRAEVKAARAEAKAERAEAKAEKIKAPKAAVSLADVGTAGERKTGVDDGKSKKKGKNVALVQYDENSVEREIRAREAQAKGWPVFGFLNWR